MKAFLAYSGSHMPMEGMYKGQTCFLILSGPSLNQLKLGKLDRYGIASCGINNSPAIYRPKLWISVDNPANFMLSIWRDPTIQKYVMYGKRGKKLWDNEHWCWSGYKVEDCPNVIYYNDNEHFNPDTYLREDTFNWGNHTDRCCGCGELRAERAIKTCTHCGSTKFGSRSVMLAAVKLLYVLGFKKVFLLGADFKMQEDGNVQNYAWNQRRTKSSVRNNNSTYERLNIRFDALRPLFEAKGFYVFNSTPDSGLKSFPYIPFDEAIEIASQNFPSVYKESAFGMYERDSIEKDIDNRKKKLKETKEELKKCNGDKVKSKELQKRIEKFDKKLKEAQDKRRELAEWARA